jgi:hypothetical protein
MYDNKEHKVYLSMFSSQFEVLKFNVEQFRVVNLCRSVKTVSFFKWYFTDQNIRDIHDVSGDGSTVVIRRLVVVMPTR